MAEKLLPIQEAIKAYPKESDRDWVDAAEEERQVVLQRFPLESWQDMPLEDYAVGQENSDDTFCRWVLGEVIEYKTHDERQLAPADVYQLFLYAYVFGKKTLDSSLSSALLIYPSGSTNQPIVDLHIKNRLGVTGARIRVIGIHIPTALEEARNKFNGTVSQALRTLLDM